MVDDVSMIRSLIVLSFYVRYEFQKLRSVISFMVVIFFVST